MLLPFGGLFMTATADLDSTHTHLQPRDQVGKPLHHQVSSLGLALPRSQIIEAHTFPPAG